MDFKDIFSAWDVELCWTHEIRPRWASDMVTKETLKQEKSLSSGADPQMASPD